MKIQVRTVGKAPSKDELIRVMIEASDRLHAIHHDVEEVNDAVAWAKEATDEGPLAGTNLVDDVSALSKDFRQWAKDTHSLATRLGGIGVKLKNAEPKTASYRRR